MDLIDRFFSLSFLSTFLFLINSQLAMTSLETMLLMLLSGKPVGFTLVWLIIIIKYAVKQKIVFFKQEQFDIKTCQLI